jgi:hypothetical protein
MNPVRIDPKLLPTPQELSRATIVAGVVASVLLVTAVLPAEAGVDPTGVGRWLGLTTLGELKREGGTPVPVTGGAPPVAAPGAVAAGAPVDASAPAPTAYALRTDELTLTLKPKEGAEIKAVMRSGDQLVYAWTADKGELFFDFHGEPKGAPPDVFTSFEKGSTTSAEGDFEAPFEGVHGWYWENRTAEVVTVKLQTSGVYEKIARRI